MSWSRTYIAYDGPALETGAMDVRELGPALLGLSDLCQRANHLLNGDRARVSVKLRAQSIRPGSFEFAIELWQSLPDQVRDLFTAEHLKTAKEILGYLGFGSGTIGLIQLVKWLRGKRPEKVREVDGDRFEFTGNNGHTTIVNRPVFNLFYDRPTRDAVTRTLEPLEKPGINRFEVSHGKHRKVVVEEIKQDEVGYFKTLPEGAEDGETVADTTTTRALEVIRPSFSGSYKWTLSEGRGGATIQATLRDQRYISRVDSSSERFGKGDLLKVQLRSETRMTASGLRTDHEILEVIQHIRAENRQLRIRDSDDQ